MVSDFTMSRRCYFLLQAVQGQKTLFGLPIIMTVIIDIILFTAAHKALGVETQ